jgi:hypothetical protein
MDDDCYPMSDLALKQKLNMMVWECCPGRMPISEAETLTVTIFDLFQDAYQKWGINSEPKPGETQ